MRAKLHYLHSPDVNLETFQPDDPSSFGILVQAMIGPQDEKGYESFDFVVCSPQWFGTRYLDSGYVWGRHYLFVRTYDLGKIRQAIEKLCLRAEGDHWDEIAGYLSRYCQWEFEDYKEYAG
jgi:hypothetical protein